MNRISTVFVLPALVLGLYSFSAWAHEDQDHEEEYVQSFREQFKEADPIPALAEYATAARYDKGFLGEALDKALENVHNDTGGLAWGLSYRMMSLNDMYRATGDTKYLDANLRCILATLDATDDKRGKKLWTGSIAAAWGCEKYAKRGRAVFAVHTGIITAPMFDYLLLAKGKDSPSADVKTRIREGATAALAVHDRQWREGPGEGEGYYFGLDQEEVCENKPLPGNRISAMGWALWRAWQFTGNEVHRDRALAIGRYMKHRLTLAPDGAYYWPYWLPEEAVEGVHPRESVTGEDTSHAGLTLRLALVLGESGEVFSEDDMKRFAKTVVNGFARRDDGILISRITGTTELKPSYIGLPSNWLPLAQYDPEVGKRITQFFLRYKASPSPLGLAQLVLHMKTLGP